MSLFHFRPFLLGFKDNKQCVFQLIFPHKYGLFPLFFISLHFFTFLSKIKFLKNCHFFIFSIFKFFQKIKNLKSQVFYHIFFKNFIIYYFNIFFNITVLVRDISFKVVITPSLPIPEYFQPPKGISNDLKNDAPFIIAPPHSN